MKSLKKLLNQGNAKVLREQAENVYVYAMADIEKAKRFWKDNRYWKAIHSAVAGPWGEFFEHGWRWVMYLSAPSLAGSFYLGHRYGDTVALWLSQVF